MKIIGTKWVFRNKVDENGIVSRNKARLVAQGYNQQEGIYYNETYAPVARLESITILLAYACALDFKLFQMDVKSAFLNGFINEEEAKDLIRTRRVFCEKIRGLEFDLKNKNTKIENLMNELEQIKKEKEGLDSKLTGFESASKDLDTLLGSQRSDKNKEGLRYTSVSAAMRVNTAASRPNVNSARPKTTQDLMIIKLIQRVKRDKIGRFSEDKKEQS
nr:copia protein [Tanacetum cinerariifolium]